MSKAKDNRKRDAENKLERITKTCRVWLVGNDGLRIDMGDFELTEVDPGPTHEDFADAAYKAARASISRLMTPQYRLVVIDGQREQGYGLDRWIKLVDGREEEARALAGKGPKQRIRKTVKA
jgi:hypothetical protein